MSPASEPKQTDGASLKKGLMGSFWPRAWKQASPRRNQKDGEEKKKTKMDGRTAGWAVEYDKVG
jgi:hypothetical protein